MLIPISVYPVGQDVPVKILDSDARKIVVEEDEDDAVPDVAPVPTELKSGGVGPPTVKAVEVDAISDPKDAEPVVSHGIGSPLTPPFLTIDSLSPQVDLKESEPIPSEGLPPFVPGRESLLTSRRACDGREG